MQFRTDMAIERRDIYKRANNLEKEIPGIECEEKVEGDNIKITRVRVNSKEGEDAIGKPVGTYITIDVKNLKIASEEEIEKTAICVNNQLQELIQRHIKAEEDILVVGLGNLAVTPDSLRTKSCARH